MAMSMVVTAAVEEAQMDELVGLNDSGSDRLLIDQ